MSDLRHSLEADHRRIDRMLTELKRCVEANDQVELHLLWGHFEKSLLSHMDWEEMYVLPSYEERDSQGAQAIRKDHARFRSCLGDMGVAVDLHTLRAATFDELANDLKAHSERETKLYEWSNEQGKTEKGKSLLYKFRHMVR